MPHLVHLRPAGHEPSSGTWNYLSCPHGLTFLLLQKAPKFHYHKKWTAQYKAGCICLDPFLIFRLLVSVCGTCWVPPNKWYGTVSSEKIGHTRARDRSSELEKGGAILWGCFCFHPWGEIMVALQSVEILFPNRKVLYCLMHGNLILSKHAPIRRIHLEASLAHKIVCLH